MAFTFKHGDRPLEGYEIQRGVGRGGFGEVYYAISDGGREVALKYLRENPEIELRGISQCINLKSPHLVSIFDVKQNATGEYFVVMEYISGPSLRDMLIAEPDGLGPQKAAFFLREIAKGLTFLHDRGIVHRDLKPGNIFYEDGYVKIGDYGLSKAISASQPAERNGFFFSAMKPPENWPKTPPNSITPVARFPSTSAVKPGRCRFFPK